VTAKQYLRQVKRLDDIVNAKLEQVHALRDLAARITSRPSVDGVQVSGNHDKIGDAIAKIIDLERDINETVNRLIDLKREVITNIDRVPTDDYRLLLTLRYLNFKTWEQIAVDMCYTYKWVHILHGRALEEFEKVLAERVAS
jgi:hypothetical protein